MTDYDMKISKAYREISESLMLDFLHLTLPSKRLETYSYYYDLSPLPLEVYSDDPYPGSMSLVTKKLEFVKSAIKSNM